MAYRYVLNDKYELKGDGPDVFFTYDTTKLHFDSANYSISIPVYSSRPKILIIFSVAPFGNKDQITSYTIQKSVADYGEENYGWNILKFKLGEALYQDWKRNKGTWGVEFFAE